MLDTDLSGSQLHWYLCLLLLETLPPTSYRNILITKLLGALKLDMWMWRCFRSTAMQLWCHWHFISYFDIWNQILSCYSFGACGDILFSSLFQARYASLPLLWVHKFYLYLYLIQRLKRHMHALWNIFSFCWLSQLRFFAGSLYLLLALTRACLLPRT